MPAATSRLVACMATFPARKDITVRAIASLVDQVDHLYIYLNQYDEIPDAFAHPKVTTTLARDGVGDLRDLGKFYFIDGLQDDTVLLVDDDILYPPDYAATLTAALRRFAVPAVVGVHGRILQEGFTDYFTHSRLIHFQDTSVGDMLVDVLGTGTVAFVPGRVGVTFDMVAAKGMADIDMAIIARRNHVPMVAIAHKAMWMRDLSAQAGSSVGTLFDEFQARGEEPADVLRAGAAWGLDGMTTLIERAFPEALPIPLASIVAGAISSDLSGAGLWRSRISEPSAEVGECSSRLAVRALRGQLSGAELASLSGAELDGYQISYIIERSLAPLPAEHARSIWQSALVASRMNAHSRSMVGRAVLTCSDLSGPDYVDLFASVVATLPVDDSEVLHKMAMRFARIAVRKGLSVTRQAVRSTAARIPKKVRSRTRVFTHRVGEAVLNTISTGPIPDVRDEFVRGLKVAALDAPSAAALWTVARASTRLRVPDKVVIAMALSGGMDAGARFAQAAELVAAQRRPNIPTLLTLQESAIIVGNGRGWVPEDRVLASNALVAAARKSASSGKGKAATLTLLRILQGIDPAACGEVARELSWEPGFAPEVAMLTGSTTPLQALNALWLNLGLASVESNAALDWRTDSPRETISTQRRTVAQQPLITVCVAVYNAEQTVVGAVESILNQTIPDISVVCVDDGSRDATLDVLHELASVDARVTVLRSPKPLGPYGIRNMVLEHCAAPYFAIADADDWSHPQRLELQLAELRAASAQVAVARHIRIAQGSFIDENSGRLFGDGLSSALYDRSVFESLGHFLPTRTRGDVEFLARVRRLKGKSAVVSMPTPLVLAQHNLGSNSHRFDKTEVAAFRKRWQAFHDEAARQTGDLSSFMRDAESRLFPAIVPPSMRVR